MRKRWLPRSHPVSKFIDRWVYNPLFNLLEHIFSEFGCFYAIILMVASWATHVVYCIIHGKLLLLIIGALAFPIGIIHGIMVWFGAGQ